MYFSRHDSCALPVFGKHPTAVQQESALLQEGTFPGSQRENLRRQEQLKRHKNTALMRSLHKPYFIVSYYGSTLNLVQHLWLHFCSSGWRSAASFSKPLVLCEIYTNIYTEYKIHKQINNNISYSWLSAEVTVFVTRT